MEKREEKQRNRKKRKEGANGVSKTQVRVLNDPRLGAQHAAGLPCIFFKKKKVRNWAPSIATWAPTAKRLENCLVTMLLGQNSGVQRWK